MADPTDKKLSKNLPIAKSPNFYKNAYLSGIKDDSKKTLKERKKNSIDRLDKIDKMQYSMADENTKGKKIKEIGKIAEQNKKNKEYGKKLALKELKLDKKYGPGADERKKQQSAKAMDTGSTFAKGGKASKMPVARDKNKPSAHSMDKKAVMLKSGGRTGYSVGGRAMRGVSKILMKK